MSPQRAQPTESPADIPRLATPQDRRDVGAREVPAEDGRMAQLAGALSALAGRVDRQGERIDLTGRQQPNADQLRGFLEQARGFVTEVLGEHPGVELGERVAIELKVARYLAGEPC